MLISCVVIFIRALRRKSVESRSDEPYMDADTIKLIGISAGSIGATLTPTRMVAWHTRTSI